MELLNPDSGIVEQGAIVREKLQTIETKRVII
jgi:hypothetical protein